MCINIQLFWLRGANWIPVQPIQSFCRAMRVRVVKLLEAGIRRSSDSCRGDAGVVGELVVLEIGAAGNSERRALRNADLLERIGTAGNRPILPSLADVLLLRVTPRGMLLRGFEYHQGQHVAQEWWCEVVG